VRLGRVLDHGEAVTLGDRLDLVHVGWEAVQVHRQDRARPLGDALLDSRRVEVVRARIDVAEDGNAALVRHRHRARDERERRDDHLVARPEARGGGRAVQGRRPRVEREAEAHAEVARPLLLERRDLGRVRTA